MLLFECIAVCTGLGATLGGAVATLTGASVVTGTAVGTVVGAGTGLVAGVGETIKHTDDCFI